MKELALHIMDIAQNSLTAGATVITIEVQEDTATDLLEITINDNGCGMPPDVLARVTDPYTTSRTTRKVGMGLPLLRDAAVMAQGELRINSLVGKGTSVHAAFRHSHWDRQPLGDIAGIITLLVQSNLGVDFIYRHSKNGKEYVFDTREVREILQGIPLNTPDVVRLMREMLETNLEEIQIG